MMTRVESLRPVLRHVHAVLERHGIWHCLMYGTLLGAVRDGDIIAWDHDIDLLVRPADTARIVALNDEVAEEGLYFWKGLRPGNRLALNPGRVPWYDIGVLEVVSDGSTCGELWAPSLFSDGVLRHYDFETEVLLYPQDAFAAFFVEELGTAEIAGETYPAPARAEALVSWLYGDDWRTPYRSSRDGGERREGRTSHGDVSRPDLAAHVAWCESQGWDRTKYAGQPVWPRRLRGAGPVDWSERTAHTTRSPWWHTLDEVANHY